MRRLKIYCPFHGKYWPLNTALAAGFLAWIYALQHDWPEEALRAAVLFAPMTVLGVSYYFIQRMTPVERDLAAQAEYPVWKPVTQDIIRKVQTEKKRIGWGTFYGLYYFGCFSLYFLLPGKGNAPNLKAGIPVYLVFAVIFIADVTTRSAWQKIDESAVMTKIPIDHMFDAVRHGEHGSEWTNSYLVFYLPDGRYVLHAGSGTGDANTLIMVKYHGMLTWLPVREKHPEDYML